MTLSQFSNASNRQRKNGSSGGRDDEGGNQGDLEDREWRRDKLDIVGTVVRVTSSLLYSS